jgi:hypothetical protein
MAYPTLTEASAALGINIATLIEQLQRLEHDLGTPLFHRATPASETQRPTPRGAQLLHALQRPDIRAILNAKAGTAQCILPSNVAGPASPDGLPPDLLRAVHGQTSGWTRLERFATAMAHHSITDAANTIGINRTTLIEQLQRLEADIGTTLFHRATADGQPHHPTHRGVALLEALARPDIRPLRTARSRLPRISS